MSPPKSMSNAGMKTDGNPLRTLFERRSRISMTSVNARVSFLGISSERKRDVTAVTSSGSKNAERQSHRNPRINNPYPTERKGGFTSGVNCDAGSDMALKLRQRRGGDSDLWVMQGRGSSLPPRARTEPRQAAIFGALKGIANQENEFRDSTITELLKTWVARDPNSAKRWAQTQSDLPQEARNHLPRD